MMMNTAAQNNHMMMNSMSCNPNMSHPMMMPPMPATTPGPNCCPMVPPTITAHENPKDCWKSLMANRYKTSICAKWKKTGTCLYGDRCMYAHGEDDLRTKEQNTAAGITCDKTLRAHQRQLAAQRLKTHVTIAQTKPQPAAWNNSSSTSPLQLNSSCSDDGSLNYSNETSGATTASCSTSSNAGSDHTYTPNGITRNTSYSAIPSVVSPEPSEYNALPLPMPAEVRTCRPVRHMTPEEQAQGFHSNNPYATWEYNPNCRCRDCNAHCAKLYTA